MCGRYTLTTPLEGIRQLFEVHSDLNLPPRYNIAPTQKLPVVRWQAGEKNQKSLALLRWGLIPSWAKDATIASKLINARADTIGEKASFRRAFRKRRCLVPANGFYEWKTINGVKQPFYISRAENELFAFAGLWESWENPEDGEVWETFCIITTDAAPSIAMIHHRMPVILPARTHDRWLADDTEKDILQGLLTSFAEEPLTATPVSRRVNKVANDDVDLIAPLTLEEPDEKLSENQTTPRQGELF
ncbi:MAG: SOS response-associated peptidase [Kiloniellales bacterium]|nr:SOS response-associated peptidase [Kiloniellales bacterium]